MHLDSPRQTVGSSFFCSPLQCLEQVLQDTLEIGIQDSVVGQIPADKESDKLQRRRGRQE